MLVEGKGIEPPMNADEAQRIALLDAGADVLEHLFGGGEIGLELEGGLQFGLTVIRRWLTLGHNCPMLEE